MRVLHGMQCYRLTKEKNSCCGSRCVITITGCPLQLFLFIGQFDFLDLGSQFFHAAVAVDSVGDVVAV